VSFKANVALNLVSISPTFYVQFLQAQIPKAQKYSQAISIFLLLGSAGVKGEHEMLMKLTPDYFQSVTYYLNTRA